MARWERGEDLPIHGAAENTVKLQNKPDVGEGARRGARVAPFSDSYTITGSLGGTK